MGWLVSIFCHGALPLIVDYCYIVVIFFNQSETGDFFLVKKLEVRSPRSEEAMKIPAVF